MNNDTCYSILKLRPESADTSIQLGFRCSEDGRYSLIVDELSFEPPTTVYLKDKLYNTTTKLIKNQAYNFYHNNSFTENRFELEIGNNPMPENIPSTENKSVVNVWSYSKKIYIDLSSEGKCNVEIFNLLGIKVYENYLNGAGLSTIEINKEGIYLVRLKNSDINYTGKVLVR